MCCNVKQGQPFIKTIKDRKSRVLFCFTFVEWIFDRKDKLDFRFHAVTSVAYGKAMDVLEKDKELWDEMLDRSCVQAIDFR